MDMRLTCRVLALTSGQHLTQNGFLNFGLVDAGARDNLVNHRCAQIMCRSVGKCAVKTADSSPCCRNDYDIGHD